MSRTAVAAARPKPLAAPQSTSGLLREMLWLAGPVLVENLLYVAVGFTDTWIANNLVPEGNLAGAELDAARGTNAAAAAAVGTITYVIWFLRLVSLALGAGSTALVARATGARHRTMANAAAGQSVLLATGVGIALGLAGIVVAEPIGPLFGLEGQAQGFLVAYLKLLSLATPFAVVTLVVNACLRGAGDTRTPAVVMGLVNALNVLLSLALVRGWFGLPAMGFDGIAVGTAISYAVGGVVATATLARGRRGVKLRLIRLRPHWHMSRRLLRIGLPAAWKNCVQWAANIVIVVWINQMGNLAAASHVNTIRMESFSFMSGLAFGVAAATMVGQSLGMADVDRARRSVWLAFCVGGTLMVAAGLVFVAASGAVAGLLTDDPAVRDLTATCLTITGLVQIGFAAAIIFGSALEGAGDTFTLMLINLGSTLAIRLPGVYLVTNVMGMGLVAVWLVLSGELLLRGAFLTLRFHLGGWHRIKV